MLCSSPNTSDVCSLDSTIWRDCSFIQAIDFTSIAEISQNSKCVHTFNELEPSNSIKNNIDDGDGQSSEDTIIAVPLDSYFNSIDCNLDNGESRLNPNGRCEQPYELKPDDDCLFDLPLTTCEQSLSMVGSNLSHTKNNVKEIKIDVTQVFTTNEKRVNKKVMAMFEKAEDEYNDLISKKNIIENDKSKIKMVIEELDEKKKETLKVTWVKVNNDFGSIFSTLLPGTMAKLEQPEGGSFLDGLEVRVAFGGV
ncbi:hypothetical protein LguiB_023853 [Lonicera macranthoides]